MANYNLNASYTGLGTFIIGGCPTADVYIISGTLALPSVAKGSSANSQVIVTVKQNSSTVYTGLLGAEGFRTEINAAANDIVSVILSSSAPVDQGLHAIHMTVSMYEGGQ